MVTTAIWQFENLFRLERLQTYSRHTGRVIAIAKSPSAIMLPVRNRKGDVMEIIPGHVPMSASAPAGGVQRR